VNGAKSVYTVSKCKRNIKGWTLPGFKEEALQLYRHACVALAAGDRTALRHLASPAVYSDLKRQIKHREDAGWARVDWALPTPPTLREIEVVQGRMVAADPKDDATAFAQLTVRFRSAQRFAAYDRRGRLVAGDPGAELWVDDHWVFERPLKGPSGSRWRVAGRLSVPPQLADGRQAAAAAAATAGAPHGELQSQRRPPPQQQQQAAAAARGQRRSRPSPGDGK
jgi:large subunit ribosomal protein L45